MTKISSSVADADAVTSYVSAHPTSWQGRLLNAVGSCRARALEIFSRYIQLTKPGIIFGNLVSTLGGFFLASKGHIDPLLLIRTALGVSLVIGSGCVFNNYIDRDIDIKMRRTQKRVLVQGLVPTVNVLAYGSLLGVSGFGVLYFGLNPLSAYLGAFGFAIYVGVYSLYMKRQSVHGTLIGSLAGAVPPVIGYCAVTNQFDLGAALLLLIFSLWQMPHSYAIAILYLDDYAAAGIPVLPVKKGIRSAKKQILSYLVAFTASALLLSLYGYTGTSYFAVTACLGLYWFYLALSGYKAPNDRIWARRMFVFSIICVMVLSLMMSVDFS